MVSIKSLFYYVSLSVSISLSLCLTLLYDAFSHTRDGTCTGFPSTLLFFFKAALKDVLAP